MESVVLRFELNGELEGIRGLVATPLILGLPSRDVYVEVYPPLVDGHHELIVYYLHSVSKNLTPIEAFSLASVLAAANHYNPSDPDYVMRLAREKPSLLLHDALKLYADAQSFDPANSTITTEGIHVRVKVIPGVKLVWAGGLGLALAGLATALLAGFPRPSGGRSA